ncbi:hypothetical protein MKW98_030234, partial [Papaver atlanticum]
VPVSVNVADLLSLKGCLQLDNAMYNHQISGMGSRTMLDLVLANWSLTNILGPSPGQKDFIDDSKILRSLPRSLKQDGFDVVETNVYCK